MLERARGYVQATEQRLADAREALARARRRDRAELQQRIRQLETSLTQARQEFADCADAVAAGDIDRWLDQHEMELVESCAAGRELAERRADAHWRARQAVELDADPALEQLLGRRPEAPEARERWERAAAAQEAYRLQYGELPDAHQPDGLPERQAADLQYAEELAEQLQEPPTAELLPGINLDDYGPDLGP